MKKKYTGRSKMAVLISENYDMLLLMSRFGISLGVGEKSIQEVCKTHNVDVDTFLYVVNYLLSQTEGDNMDLHKRISIPQIIKYLINSHTYFLQYRLPELRIKLLKAIDAAPKDVVYAITTFYDGYTEGVRKHMEYEDKFVFPYATKLIEGEKDPKYSIEVFRKKHDQIELQIMELKNILIKYYTTPAGYQLHSVLHDIFACQKELADHNNIEDHIFIPAVAKLEQEVAEKAAKTDKKKEK